MEKYIDEIISKGAENEYFEMQSRHNFEIDSEYKLYLKAIVFLKQKNIIIKGTKSGYELSEIAIDIKNDGGWKEYNIKQLKIKHRNELKVEYDFILSKWKVKTFWPLFIIAILGGLYSLYDVIIKTPSISKDVQELQQTIKQMELDISKQNTLILNQRNLDSLHNSKIHVDSLKIN